MNRTVKRYFPIFVLPTLIAFIIAFAVPFVMGLVLSFTEFRTVTDATFVGFSNYVRAFTDDKLFINAMWFTVKFAVISVIGINVFAFLLALLFTKELPGTNFFRTVFFMPNLIGGIVLGYIWQVIINGVLYKYGYSITSSPTYGFWGLVILMHWQMIGYMMIIYIAGIQNIPGGYYRGGKGGRRKLGYHPFQNYNTVGYALCYHLPVFNHNKFLQAFRPKPSPYRRRTRRQDADGRA